MKIGLFGGSFNPIHNAHLKIINELLNKKIVDEIWITPCKKHPLDKDLESEKDRVSMIESTIKNLPKVKINKIELNSKGKSYTIKTLNKLKEKYSHDFFLIIGSDILYEIKGWYDYKSLLKKIEFIIIERRDFPIKRIKDMKIRNILRENPSGISSSIIRKKILQNKFLKEIIPKDVEDYIIKNKLYKTQQKTTA